MVIGQAKLKPNVALSAFVLLSATKNVSKMVIARQPFGPVHEQSMVFIL